MKILFLCHRIPYPPDKGDKIRSFNELVYLSKKHEIHLATILDRESDNEYINTLGKYCKRVFAVRFNRKIRLLKSIISGKPFSVSNFYCRDLQEFVDDALETNNIDAVICYCSSMAEYIFNNPKYRENQLKNMKLIMDFVDLDSDKWLQFSRYASFPANLIYRLENKRLLRYEVEVNKAIRLFYLCIRPGSGRIQRISTDRAKRACNPQWSGLRILFARKTGVSFADY